MTTLSFREIFSIEILLFKGHFYVTVKTLLIIFDLRKLRHAKKQFVKFVKQHASLWICTKRFDCLSK